MREKMAEMNARWRSISIDEDRWRDLPSRQTVDFHISAADLAFRVVAGLRDSHTSHLFLKLLDKAAANNN